MCKKLANAYSLVLRNNPEWIITPKILEVLDNNNLDFNDLYNLFTCYQQKAYKNEIYKELMSIAWH